MDIIFIESFRVDTVIGAYDRERYLAQPVEIDLRIGLSTASAGASENLADTIDYAAVVQRLRDDLSHQHFKLLEALAEHIATLLLEEFGAAWVRVSVAKLGMMPGVKRVGIIIERGSE